MRVYIAGPMTGIPEYNFPAFHAAAAAWRAQGHEVVNPAEMDEALDGFDAKTDAAKPHEHYMRRDLPALCACDAVALLPGWEKSKGAKNELAVARMCGLTIYEPKPSGLGYRIVEATTEPEAILEEAQRLVHGNRGADYGHPIEDYTRTGRIWGALLGIGDIDPRLCCLMMAGVKLSREVNKHKRDNLTDLAGYAECASMVAKRQGLP